MALVFLFSACQEQVSDRPSSTATPVSSADLQARILEILKESDRLDRVEMLMPVLRGLTADQTNLLEGILRARRLPYRDVETILIVSAWANFDPPAAAKWAIKSERIREIQPSMTADVLRTWARRDPAAVLQAYQVVGRSDPSMLVGLIEGWFESGQPGLESFVLAISDDDDRQTAIAQLVRIKVANDGIDGVREWAESQSGDTKYRQILYANTAASMASFAPEQAVEWCNEICEKKVGKHMREWIALRWAAYSGADAMNWLLTQPDIVQTRATTRGAYRKFLIKDREAGYAWMEAMPEDQRRSSLAQGPLGLYVNNRSWDDPEIAIDWAQYLTDESERENALKTIFNRWRKKDEAAAEAWLSQSALSEESREDFRYGSRRPGMASHAEGMKIERK